MWVAEDRDLIRDFGGIDSALERYAV